MMILILYVLLLKKEEKRGVAGEAAWRFFSSSVEMLFRSSANSIEASVKIRARHKRKTNTSPFYAEPSSTTNQKVK